MLKEIWNYIIQRKWLYTAILILLFVEYGFSVVPTKVTQTIINQISNNTHSNKFKFSISFNFSDSDINLYCRIFLG